MDYVFALWFKLKTGYILTFLLYWKKEERVFDIRWAEQNLSGVYNDGPSGWTFYTLSCQMNCLFILFFFAGANFSTTECIACRARQQTFIYITTSFVRYTNRVTTNEMRRLWNKKKSIFKPGNLSYSLACLAQLNLIGIFSYIYTQHYTYIVYIFWETAS